MKNRFMLFSGNTYYPGGGANDFHGERHEKLSDAVMRGEEMVKEKDWWHVYDLIEEEMVAFGNRLKEDEE